MDDRKKVVTCNFTCLFQTQIYSLFWKHNQISETVLCRSSGSESIILSVKISYLNYNKLQYYWNFIHLQDPSVYKAYQHRKNISSHWEKKAIWSKSSFLAQKSLSWHSDHAFLVKGNGWRSRPVIFSHRGQTGWTGSFCWRCLDKMSWYHQIPSLLQF